MTTDELRKVAEAEVILSRELFDFLMGVGELDGTSFGELNDGLPGAFWWRGLLLAAERESNNRLAALEAERAAGEARVVWQPIETAPKDGAWIWAFWPVAAVEDQQRVTQWFYEEDGPWIDSGDHIDWCQPTHWQPLSEPPRTALAQQEPRE